MSRLTASVYFDKTTFLTDRETICLCRYERNMADIPAINILQSQLDILKTFRSSFETVSDIYVFRKDSKEACSGVGTALKTVTEYANQIQTLVKKLAAEVKLFTADIQAKIRELIESLVVLEHCYVPKDVYYHEDPNIKRLENILKLQELAREISNERLEELATETEIALEKSKSAACLSQNEIDNLLGCLDSWEKHEELSHKDKEEQERLRKKKEDEERERKKKEDEEKRQKEREERLKRLEEERKKQKEEEERKRKMEEEKIRQDEEERKKKEEKRMRKLEEKRKRKEEERKKREEEERRKRREEEEEKRRLKEEEEERRRKERERLDPNNWPWHEYPREESLEVDGDRSYHKGVCCYMSAPVGNINYDDVVCNASDEIDDVIEHIAAGDKVASSLIHIKSTHGEIRTEVPLRVHVPHVPIRDPQEELVFVFSLNESSEWNTQLPVKSNKPPSSSKDLITSCLSVEAFESLSVMAVAKRKGEVIVVDPPGKIHQLYQDKNLTLVLPRETYGSTRTEMRVTVRNIVMKDIGNKLENYYKIKSEIFSAGPLMFIQCERTPLKSFELDIILEDVKRKGKVFYLVCGKDEKWISAPTGSKGIHDNAVSVTFPPGNKIYSFLEIEMPTTAREEDAFRAAEAIFSLLTKTIVNILIRQKSQDSTVGVLHVVCHDHLQQRLEELNELGYDLGEACSSEFALQDGDRIKATMSGNVCFASGVVEPIIVQFSALLDRARLNVKFAVKDLYIQRDYPYFMGRLTGQVVPKLSSIDHGDGLMVEIPINLLKNQFVRPKSAKNRFVPIKFPFYMSALTTFLADRIANTPGLNWTEVVDKLDTHRNIDRLQRQAKNKCIEGDEQSLCRMVLLDWMKEQPRHVNKMKPILEALLQCHHKKLYMEAKEFVDNYKESLSDDVLRDVNRRLTSSPKDIAKALGFTPSEVKNMTSSGSDNEQRFLLLAEWRETERAVKCSLKAADEMNKLLSKFM